MITIILKQKLNKSLNLATQIAAMQNAPLNQGEMEVLNLTILSDTTAFNGIDTISRTVELDETAAFIKQSGGDPLAGPTSVPPDARRGSVKGTFQLKVSSAVKTDIEEEILLS